MYEHKFEHLPQELLRVLHPTVTMRLVDCCGRTVLPTACSKAAGTTTACSFQLKDTIVKKKPYMCANGPKLLAVPRLRCTVHAGEFRYSTHSQDLFPAGARLEPCIVQFGEVR